MYTRYIINVSISDHNELIITRVELSGRWLNCRQNDNNACQQADFTVSHIDNRQTGKSSITPSHHEQSPPHDQYTQQSDKHYQ